MILEQLRKTPIVQIACEKLDISRATFYRWKSEDKEFAKAVDEAIQNGRLLINDLAEAQLISAIKDRNFAAGTYWLKHHHPDYTTTIQIKHALQDETLTPEQEAVVREALRLAGAGRADITSITEQHNESPEYNTAGNGGDNDKGQESPNSDH